MDYWSVLGLPADADLRTLKREYARQLKVTRPDDDPVAFQRLRDAYEAALAAVQRREERAEKHSAADLIPLVLPAPSESPAPFVQKAQLTPSRAPILEVIAPVKTDLAQAKELVEHLTIANSSERLNLARAWDCLNAFEEQLLIALGENGDVQLLEWALVSFRWLSPWQRLDLPNADLNRLLVRLQQATATGLRSYLDAGDVEGFKLERVRLMDSDWLQPIERREWLSQTLARVLLESPFWSDALVDFLNVAHGWDQDEVNRQAIASWPALVTRRQDELAEHRLVELRTSTDRHVTRATRLLFEDLTEIERRSLARTFGAADWRACEKIFDVTQAFYPTLLNRVAGGNPFFWQELRDKHADWPLYGALCIATGDAVIREYWSQGSSISATTVVLLAGLLLAGVGSWLLLKLCKLAVTRFAAIEQCLSLPLAGKSKHPEWPPSPLGEILPTALVAGAVLLLNGGPTLFVFLRSLMVLLAVRWYAPQQVRKVRQIGGWFTKESKIYMAGMAAMFVLALIWVGQENLGLAQGLQIWAQRGCLIDDGPRPCEVPATLKQWYPSERTE